MSLEQALAENTAALKVVASLLANGKSIAATTASTPAASPPAQPAGYVARYDHPTMKAKVGQVKEKMGVDAARKLVKDIGKADRSDDVSDPKLIDALYDAAEKLLATPVDDGSV